MKTGKPKKVMLVLANTLLAVIVIALIIIRYADIVSFFNVELLFAEIRGYLLIAALIGLYMLVRWAIKYIKK